MCPTHPPNCFRFLFSQLNDMSTTTTTAPLTHFTLLVFLIATEQL